MGNSIGGGRRKKARVMKINGETMKLKTPIQAFQVTKDYPGHVLIDSEAVKHFGLRAKPLEPQEHLRHTKTYFLLDLPKLPDHHLKETNPNNVTRRVQSGIHMGAKDRLELLMLSRRAVSDLTSSTATDAAAVGTGPMRVKMRLPRAQLDRLVEDSKDDAEVADKIVDLYVGKSAATGGAATRHGRNHSNSREKRVSFAVTQEEEIHFDKTSL